ncbi:rRNA primary transcript metabolism protein [Linnemannia hyalina]|uniref:rRNA primary transcript metabolism protein n=1 Tax=Linnemannia hyalina TaxID=64524 RepID=A0A9P7XW61_9FUNG|nr:rRNA primary transcript metabolism protein [Linnemannia hyalina]
MEEYLSSSEAFAKALKGLQTSPLDKIRLANEAWRRQDVVLPHKQEFLLEWLCSTLVKAATPSKNAKATSSSTITDQAHWDLFKDMLTKITHSRKLHRKYGHVAHSRHAPGHDNHAIEAQAPGVLLRVPVVPMFTALVQKLCPTTVTTTATPAKSKKNNKNTEATNPSTTPTTVTSPPTDIPSASVLESASICFNLLSGPLMTEWFQPTLEQYTPLVQATLEALIEMTQDSSTIDARTQEIMMDFAHIILDRFKRLVIIQPNQKKVFGLVAGKMFEALVRARVAIRTVPGTLQEECQKAIGAILRTGLFHQEHLQEYTAGYVAGDEKSIQSYQKQLFEQIAAMTKSTHSTAVLDVLPVLVQYFVEESRRKQRSMANSGFERGLEIAREMEFSFFKIIYMLAKRQLPNLTDEPSESSIDQLANIMDAHNKLLSAILDLNMYQPSNNEAADQYVFMSTSFGSIYSCLTTAQTLNNGRLQSISLTGIVVLAQLDDRLLKPHLDSLWPILLSPLADAHDAALELSKTLLEIYGKSSDLQIFLPSLLSALRGFVTRPQELHSSPLFTRAFLDLIPGNIRGYLPLPQAPKILDIFVSELMALDTTGMEIDGLEPLQETTHKKKRKLNSGKSQGDADASSSTVPSSELVITLFIQFLKGLRVTVNQEKQLNNEFKVVFDHFLSPTFERLARIDNSEADTSAIYQARRITPALKLHYALCRVSTQYWVHGLSLDLLEKIVGTFKATSGWSDAAVLCLNRVVLQHVHRILCSPQGMDDSLTQRCKELVQFTMKASKLKQLVDDVALVTETWDGRLETATGPKFLVASWQIQVNDWLDIICRFGTTQDLELIATVISRQFVLSSDKTSATAAACTLDINLLNQLLLRSANFYEVPNFRPIFAQKILEGLSESIAALSETAQETKLAATIASFTSQSSAHKDAKSTFAEALKELVDVTAHHRSAAAAPKSKSKKGSSTMSKAAREQGPRLLSLLSIMHLLPLEYFEKYERNIILTTMAVLDFYIQHHLSADETGVKCLLIERRISSAIMSWRSDAGVLFNDPAILLNLLHFPAWNCSTSYGSEDKDGLGHAIMDTTSAMVDSAIRFYMGQTYDERQYETAFKHFEALFKSALSWAGDALEASVYSTKASSAVALKNGQMTESRIKVVLLSHACHSLVQALEQHIHHTHKSKSKAKKATSKSKSTSNKDMDTRREMVIKEIGQLFDAVEAKVTLRIQKVVDLLKGKKRVSVEEEAQKCLDHFELFKTVVDYRQLTSAQDGNHKAIAGQSPCLKLVPELFSLAKALAHVQVSEDKTGAQGQSIAHLTALLTAYSCEYLPVSKAWSSNGSADKETLKELLVLLLDVSGHALEDKDVTMLKDAYLSLLSQLSGDLFENLLHWLLDETYRSSSTFDELVLVRYLDFTFLGVHHSQKRKVRRQISKLLTRLTQILQTTTSVQVVVGVLDMVASICSEPSFELRSWEIGLALDGIISLMSPATPLLLSPPSSSSSEATVLTNQDTSKIFTALYHVLINIARFRQEELLSQIPVFTSILQSCFHGFKSLHGSIAKRQQGVESLLKSPFMLLSAGVIPASSGPHVDAVATPVAKTKNESAPTTQSTTERIPIIGDPLPVECAENFARLLTTLGSKPVTTYNNSSSSSNTIDLPSTATTTGNSASFSITTDASKAFGKHIPYLLMEYFTIQSSVTASIRLQPLRNALLPGLYALMNLCTDYERELMMSGLDNTGKVLLKGLYTDYLKYHKYTGR